MKNVYYNRLEDIEKLFDLWKKTSVYKDKGFVIYYFKYIFMNYTIEKDKIFELYKDKCREEKVMLTIAEQLKLEGEIIEKQNVLIKQLSKKFGLTEEEKSFIKSVKDRAKLDKALEEILTEESKEVLLNYLK